MHNKLSNIFIVKAACLYGPVTCIKCFFMGAEEKYSTAVAIQGSHLE